MSDRYCDTCDKWVYKAEKNWARHVAGRAHKIAREIYLGIRKPKRHGQ